MTIFTGFTSGECELLRIRYASLARADPGTPYPTPQLCNTNDCNGAVFGSKEALVPSGAARATAAGAAAAAASVLWALV